MTMIVMASDVTIVMPRVVPATIVPTPFRTVDVTTIVARFDGSRALTFAAIPTILASLGRRMRSALIALVTPRAFCGSAIATIMTAIGSRLTLSVSRLSIVIATVRLRDRYAR